MGYIYSVDLESERYLIEPLLYATAGGTATALTAGINNFTLVAGAYVHIKVNDVNANATLNVNSTGAKDIYYNGVQIGTGMLSNGNIYTFIYDGTQWNVIGDIIGKNIMIGTTQDWSSHYAQVYPRGTIIIYSDHGTITETDANQQEVTKSVPGIKITDGSTPLISLPFVGDDVAAAIRAEINNHINNNIVHITAEERTKWNNKITCTDAAANHNLVITRN